MTCHHYRYHKGDTQREKLISRTSTYIKNSKPHSINHNIKLNVTGNKLFSTCDRLVKLPKCNETSVKTRKVTLIPSTTGFYFKNNWRSLICHKETFNSKQKVEVLRHKLIHFIGDSTLRQWYDYLYLNIGASFKGYQIGPKGVFKQSYDKQNNISMIFSFHGFPIRGVLNRVQYIDYIANQLDALIGGDETIIVITIWAHFTVNNLDFYRQRIETIKRSIIRLLVRSPTTQIFIKSANTRDENSVAMSNVYAYQLEQLMRETMGALSSVIILDTWDMTMGHKSGFKVHPEEDVIRSEMDMFLSYL